MSSSFCLELVSLVTDCNRLIARQCSHCWTTSATLALVTPLGATCYDRVSFTQCARTNTSLASRAVGARSLIRVTSRLRVTDKWETNEVVTRFYVLLSLASRVGRVKDVQSMNIRYQTVHVGDVTGAYTCIHVSVFKVY